MAVLAYLGAIFALFVFVRLSRIGYRADRYEITAARGRFLAHLDRLSRPHATRPPHEP